MASIILKQSYQIILGVEIECLSWHLDFNAHVPCYQTAASYYEGFKDDFPDVDFEKDIFCLTMYIRNCVTFHILLDNSLQGIKDRLLKFVKEEQCK